MTMPSITQNTINNLSKVDFIELVEVAKVAAVLAGKDILEIYHQDDFGIETKDDESPLTTADKKAHLRIVEGLKGTDIPILSEEGRSIPFEERNDWSLFWMTDPLDGTKEFIKRNSEFTVNIALIEQGKPILGVVYAPVLDKLYYGGTAVGFSKMTSTDDETILNHRKESTLEEIKNNSARIVASRSHQNLATQDFINSCKNSELVSMGSSLKFMLVAEGNADVYPRFAPTMEWDTAAADAILRGLGYNIFQVSDEGNITSHTVEYNKKNLLNPYFIAY